MSALVWPGLFCLQLAVSVYSLWHWRVSIARRESLAGKLHDACLSNLDLRRQLNTKVVRELGLTNQFIADRWVPIGSTICLVNPVDFPGLFDKPSGGAS